MRTKQGREGSLDRGREAFQVSFFLSVFSLPSSSSSLVAPSAPRPSSPPAMFFSRLAVPAVLAAVASVVRADAISTEGLTILVPGGDSLWWGTSVLL